jgi:hypothetical protein
MDIPVGMGRPEPARGRAMVGPSVEIEGFNGNTMEEGEKWEQSKLEVLV